MISNDIYTDDWIDGDIQYTYPPDFDQQCDGVIYGTLTYLKFPSATVGKERDVAVLLPAGYRPDKKYPVLYLLHGFARDHTMWPELANIQWVQGNLNAQGKSVEMIIVMPNCRARMDDRPHPADEWTLEHAQAFNNFIHELKDDLIPFIHAHYSVAKGRENTAVAGFSMGGRLALYVGFTMQETFGYIGAFCPAPGVFAYENICSMSENGLFKENELRLQERFADSTYVVIAAGKDDDAVLNSPDRYHTALKENGCKHVWYKITGGHWFVQVGRRVVYQFLQDIFKV